MTVRDFAASRGITRATLYWWRSRLGRRRQAADLVPVEVVEHDIERRSPHDASFELHVGGSVVLRVPAGFDEGELRRLVRALRC